MKPKTEHASVPPEKKVPMVKKASQPLADSHKGILGKLQHLRSQTQTAGRAYLTNLEHDILELADLVGQSGKRRRFKKSTIQQMENLLDKISIKPEKGRRRDLKKIEQAIEAMQNLVGNK